MINMNRNLKALPVVNVHLDMDYALISATPIRTAKGAIEFVASKLFDSAHEKATAIFLDATLVPICMASVVQGDQSGVTFSARDIVQTVLLCNASYVTLIHNHPGVNLTKKHCGPSREDILVTDTIVKACSTVGVQVYDSIIASGENIPDPARETDNIEYIIPGNKDRNAIKEKNEENHCNSEKMVSNHIKIIELGLKSKSENLDLSSMIDK